EDLLPLGIYHLYSADKKSQAGALAVIRLYNLDPKSERKLKLELTVDGVTQTTTKSVILTRGGHDEGRVGPPLKLDFDIDSIRSSRPTQCNVKISETQKGAEKVILEESLPITILPRMSMPRTKKVAEDIHTLVDGYFAAWITPKAKKIQAFLSEVKKLAP